MLLLKNSTKVAETKKSIYCTAVFKVILVILYMAGVLLCCQSILDNPGLNWNIVYAVIIVISIVIGICLTIPHVNKYVPVIPVICSVLIMIYVGFGRCISGILYIINTIIGIWNISRKDGIRMFSVSNVSEDMIIYAVLVVLLLIMALLYAVAFKYIVIAYAVLYAITIGMCLIGRFSEAAFAFLFSSVFGMWLYSLIKKEDAFRIAWTIIIAFMSIAVIWVCPQKDIEYMDSFRENVLQGIEDIRYGKSDLPEGNLYMAHTMSLEDDKKLEVTTGQKKSMYLRGYVGGRYNNGKWDTLSKAAYRGERTGMFRWLDDNNFKPASQYALYSQLGANKSYEKNTVHIKNKGADRQYLYLPYSSEVSKRSGFKADYDNGYKSKNIMGCFDYEFDEYSDLLPSELIMSDEWLENPEDDAGKQYVEAESVYRDFVYENYMNVPSNLNGMIYNIFKDGAKLEDTSIYAVTDHIRETLKHIAIYDIDMPEITEDIEPVRYFLKESHRGNSVLFASAAVFAYRIYEIPARYVEGYYLNESEIDDMGKAIIKGKDSHAWVEIYMDGLGWMPIEVTPGYYFDAYTLQNMLEFPKNVEKTASLQAQEEGAQHVDGGSDMTPGESIKKKIGWGIYFALGCIMLVILIAVIAVFIMELVFRMIMQSRKKGYAGMEDADKIHMLYKSMYVLLMCTGINIRLGFDTEQTEKMLLQKSKVVEEGEYVRVCSLVEKFYYGGIPLKQYEMRLIESFVLKLYEENKSKGLLYRLKIRFKAVRAIKSIR